MKQFIRLCLLAVAMITLALSTTYSTEAHGHRLAFSDTTYQQIKCPLLKEFYMQVTQGAYKDVQFGSGYASVIERLGTPGQKIDCDGSQFLLYSFRDRVVCLSLREGALVYFCEVYHTAEITVDAVRETLGEPWKEIQERNREGRVKEVALLYGSEECGKKMCISWEDGFLYGYCVADLCQKEFERVTECAIKLLLAFRS